MMIRRITSLYQSGTEFRTGAYRGTQFRLHSLELQEMKSPILKAEAQ